MQRDPAAPPTAPIPPPPLWEDDLAEQPGSLFAMSRQQQPSAPAAAAAAAPALSPAALASPSCSGSLSGSASGSLSSKKKAEEISSHNTVGVSQSQRHFARLCGILSDPAVDADTIRATLRRGVPDELRMDFWRLALGVVPLGEPGKREKVLASLAQDYEHILGVTCEDIKDGGVVDPNKHDVFPIDADVPRTMPTLHFFASRHEFKSPSSSSPTAASSPNKKSGGDVGGLNNNSTAPAAAFGASASADHSDVGSATATIARINTGAEPSPSADTAATTPGGQSDAGAVQQQPRDNSDYVTGSPGHVQNFTSTQLALRRILFLFSRVDAGGYQQGMNEMCGILLFAASGGRREAVHEVEADVFFSFQALVQWIHEHFQTVPDCAGDTGLANTLKTFSYLLRMCDEQLAEHVEGTLGIVPEFYAFRWISVLFALEFPVADVLSLWDYLLSFADKISIAAQFVAVAMLVHIRDELLSYASPVEMGKAMQLLQNYPASADINDIIATADALINRYTVTPHLWSIAAAGSANGRVSNGGDRSGAVAGAAAAGGIVGPTAVAGGAADSDPDEEDIATKLRNAKDRAMKWFSERF